MPDWPWLVLCVGRSHSALLEMVEADNQWTSLVSGLVAVFCFLKEEVLIK